MKRHAAVLMVLLCSAMAHAQVVLDWKVENRFPILTDDAFREVEQLWAISPDKSMWGFVTQRLKEIEIGPSDRYVLVNPSKANPAPNAATGEWVAIRLEARFASEDCIWSVIPEPILSPINGKCVSSMVIKRSTPTAISVRHGLGTASATVDVTEVVVVAMGDSYASGEGSPDRPAIYRGFATPKRNDWFLAGGIPSNGIVEPAQWFDERCHRSLLSWPVLASLRLALEHPRAVVRLVNATCTGAEFLDGFFMAQEKADILDRQLSSYRDGVGRRNPSEHGGRYLPTSQVNAVREAICRWSSDVQDISLPGLPYIASARSCPELNFEPDVLLMTGGGNDVKFAPAVLGVLMPEVARSKLLVPFFLKTARNVAGAIAPSELAMNTKRFAPTYKQYIDLAAWGARADSSKTVLVKYPNPIAPSTGSTEPTCTKYQERLKTSFLAFGPAARQSMPKVLHPIVNWVVDVSRGEEGVFTSSAYPSLMAMQETVSPPYTLVDWHPQSTFGPEAARSFSTRLLCSAEAPGTEARTRQDELEPIFFCQMSSGECATEPYKYRESLDSWKFLAPGRRIINTTNDALLAQRSWPANREPTFAELVAALGGTFHPVTEAHAVAADSAYEGLCSVLVKSGKHKGKVCGAPQ